MRKSSMLFKRPELPYVVFVLFTVIFNWPFITIYSSAEHGYNTFFSVFILWALFIVLVFVLIMLSENDSNSGD